MLPIALFHKPSDGQRSASPPLLRSAFKVLRLLHPSERVRARSSTTTTTTTTTATLLEAQLRFDAQSVPGANVKQRGGGEITDATYHSVRPTGLAGMGGRPRLTAYRATEHGGRR